MGTVKKFTKYLLLFLVIYFLVSLLSYGYMVKSYKNINNYDIEVNTPQIEILQSKATYVNGYIVGNVTNNTSVEIEHMYLKIDFYTKNNNYLGSNYVKVKNLSKDKKIEFETAFKYNNVDNYKISIVNEIQDNSILKDKDESLTFFKLFGIAGILAFIYYIF